eukprot:gnl/Dysnectes_brevis/1613_a1828_1881.p1 GENE.gnl/Dysnectes_brevis/1613_a1828_1881~~gnl/Dysnectes_brevis/1613_a1828_1881.p1  ORF type:complete len:270 (+),score=54.48 gnl/Dysnectes_brevis/1613_a1828_1881:52-810(+)
MTTKNEITEIVKLLHIEKHIVRVLKQIHPDMSISSAAQTGMARAMALLGWNLLAGLADLLDTQSYSTKLLQSLIQAYMPGELGKHASSEMSKAQAKYSETCEAGLTFPHIMIHKLAAFIDVPQLISRTEVDWAVGIAAVMEYISAEILELSGNAAIDHKKKRITSKHLWKGIINDDELKSMFFDILMVNSGLVPEGLQIPRFVVPRIGTIMGLDYSQVPEQPHVWLWGGDLDGMIDTVFERTRKQISRIRSK